MEIKDTKKVYLNIMVSPSVKEALERQARREDRPLSNLCDRLLSCVVKWLEEAGDSQALVRWEAGHSAMRPSKRVSEELQSQLHSELDLLFERAPGDVIERVTEYLTTRAGKYGDEK